MARSRHRVSAIEYAAARVVPQKRLWLADLRKTRRRPVVRCATGAGRAVGSSCAPRPAGALNSFSRPGNRLTFAPRSCACALARDAACRWLCGACPRGLAAAARRVAAPRSAASELLRVNHLRVACPARLGTRRRAAGRSRAAAAPRSCARRGTRRAKAARKALRGRSITLSVTTEVGPPHGRPPPEAAAGRAAWQPPPRWTPSSSCRGKKTRDQTWEAAKSHPRLPRHVAAVRSSSLRLCYAPLLPAAAAARAPPCPRRRGLLLRSSQPPRAAHRRDPRRPTCTSPRLWAYQATRLPRLARRRPQLSPRRWLRSCT